MVPLYSTPERGRGKSDQAGWGGFREEVGKGGEKPRVMSQENIINN